MIYALAARRFSSEGASDEKVEHRGSGAAAQPECDSCCFPWSSFFNTAAKNEGESRTRRQVLPVQKLLEENVRFGFEDDPFLMGESLGKGSFPSVHRCVREGTQEVMAVKVIEGVQHNRKQIMREVRILKSLDHPRLVRFREFCEQPREGVLFQMMEFVDGGNVHDRIVAQRLKEAEAKHIFRQVLEGLDYIHARNIIHLDINPENLLIVSSTPFANSGEGFLYDIKIAGFSPVMNILDAEKTTAKLGTTVYIAPEVLILGRGASYSEAADFWSLGVTTLALLCGRAPFEKLQDRKALEHLVRNGAINQQDQLCEGWAKASFAARDVVEKLLQRDIVHRLDVHGCKKHGWLTGAEIVLARDRSLADSTQEDMRKLFMDKIRMDGRLMFNTGYDFIRHAVPEEKLTIRRGSIMDPVIHCHVKKDDTSSMVLMSPTAIKEGCLISNQQFSSDWEATGTKVENMEREELMKVLKGRSNDVQSALDFLRRESFELYAQKGAAWVYSVTASDIKLVPTGQFCTLAGDRQPLRAGDFLSVSEKAFDHPDSQLDKAEIVQLSADIVASRYTQTIPRTQEEVITHFKDRIKKFGKLMKKDVHALIRQGKNEVITSEVSGKRMGDNLILDTSQYVVMPIPKRYMYAMKKDKMERVWHTPGIELDANSGLDDWADLREQGYALHASKGHSKYIYKLTESDVVWFPTRQFVAPWNNRQVQPVAVGHYLAMHEDQNVGEEVWVLHPDAVADHMLLGSQ